MTERTPVLRLDKVRMTFDGIVAIEDLTLEIQAGEIMALVGDNGAGKSTVVKMVAGVHQPTEGTIYLNGALVRFADASAARAHGIEVVYQDLALANSQSVYMNLFLGRELVTGPLRRLDRRRMVCETETLMQELDVRIPSAKAIVRDLSGGQRQGIAIARATHWAQDLVLMDEPTAALGVAETARVEKLIDTLRVRNMAILVISHNLDQVFRISDRICVLRRGVHAGTRTAADTEKNEIVSMITGLT